MKFNAVEIEKTTFFSQIKFLKKKENLSIQILKIAFMN